MQTSVGGGLINSIKTNKTLHEKFLKMNISNNSTFNHNCILLNYTYHVCVFIKNFIPVSFYIIMLNLSALMNVFSVNNEKKTGNSC